MSNVTGIKALSPCGDRDHRASDRSAELKV